MQELILAIQAGQALVEVSNGIVNGYKRMLKNIDSIKDIEKDENLLELKEFLLESKKRELALLGRLDIAELQLKQKKELKFDGVVFKDSEGNCYCPACHQSRDSRQIFLISNDPDEDEIWKCPICKSDFETKGAILRRNKQTFEALSRRLSYF